MTELKTLKDSGFGMPWKTFDRFKCVPSNPKGEKVFLLSELKAEAINRYKYFLGKMQNAKTDMEMYLYEGRCQELEENFNLTPEDLKNEN